MIDLADILAGFDGRVAAHPPVLVIEIGTDSIELTLGDVDPPTALRRRWTLPVGPASLRERELESDPPRPEELTNAIGRVADHVDDAARELPDLVNAATAIGIGRAVVTTAAVELGRHDTDELHGFVLERAAAEDVFRTLAVEDARARAHNPGLLADEVDGSVAGCCAVVAVMRRLRLDRLVVWERPQLPAESTER